MSKGRETPNFPGYCVTKTGKVWSDKTKKWLRQSTNPGGYLYVGLSRDGKGRARCIHRLVLETFIGPRPEKMQCRHLDGCLTNNRLSNLCWGTQQQNELDKIKHNTTNCGERNGFAKLNIRQVRIIRQLLKFPKEFTQGKIGGIFGISRSVISNIKRGMAWKNV